LLSTFSLSHSLTIFVFMISQAETKNANGSIMAATFNANKQHTLKTAASISGTGLHTGVMAHLTLKPATPGLVFNFKEWICPINPL
jgi:UDP-3-O-[3-hydroxymyristoyl] N-acetylglucosamine deacetylase/3-hydroxyacyl-[acyl-carrier-protein] dehydratase